MDPLDVGHKLMVSFVLAGSFSRSDSGFDLNWQLLDVPAQRVRSGGSMRVASLDLIAVQAEIANEVFAALHGLRCRAMRLRRRSARMTHASGRARLHSLALSAKITCRLARCSTRSACAPVLVQTSIAHTRCSRGVTQSDPRFADGWSGLAIAEVQYVRSGFGGQVHVMRARRAFEEALRLDPASTEANLYRIFLLLSRGEKESARHGIAELLQNAANDWNVQRIAGVALRSDGMYEEALGRFSRSLKLNPATPPSSTTIAPACTTT